VVGEQSLVHFDMSQAFAWEFLRKKQRITREDLAMAEKLQREEEARLKAEVSALRAQRRTLGDSTLALKLAEELGAVESLPDTSWRSDSAFAFALMVGGVGTMDDCATWVLVALPPPFLCPLLSTFVFLLLSHLHLLVCVLPGRGTSTLGKGARGRRAGQVAGRRA
jgi:hypothetical protein